MTPSTQEFDSILENFESDLWTFHVKVPKEVVSHYHRDRVDRLLCSINGSNPFPTAFMPAGEDVYFININKERRQKFDLGLGEKIHIRLEPDQSSYGLPMPDEFRIALDSDPEVDRLFHLLTPGKQRSLLYIVGKMKSTEKRIEKSLIIQQHLRETGGRLDYRRLKEAFTQGL